jgi:hypothetical protein
MQERTHADVNVGDILKGIGTEVVFRLVIIYLNPLKTERERERERERRETPYLKGGQ